MTSNTKQSCFPPFILHEYIQIKSKVKFLDVHQSLPWIIFCDEENNIMMFDVIEKKPIKVFNIQTNFSEEIIVKSICFFNVNDRKYIQNYELNEIKKIKGMPLSLRSALVIITLEKSICFYNFITLSLSRIIQLSELENKYLIKSEVFNYMYLIILNVDGNVIVWNLLNWGITTVISKSHLGKPITNFFILTKKDDNKYLIISTSVGSLILVDISKQEYKYSKLDNDKPPHDAVVTDIDYDPFSNNCVSVSKNFIYLVNIKDYKVNKRLPNFSYHKGEKFSNCISNLNSNFSRNTSILFGKASVIAAMDINVNKILNKKIESNDCKNLISHYFDLELLNLPKISENSFKIYAGKIVNHTEDYIVLGTNKGVVIIQYNTLIKPNLVACNKLIELNEFNLFLYKIENYSLIQIQNSIKFTLGKTEFTEKNDNLIQAISSEKTNPYNFNNFKIDFSSEFNYMSVIDLANSILIIYELTVNNSLTFSTNALKQLDACWIEWCSYLNVFAVVIPIQSIDLNSKDKKENKNKLKTVYKVNVYSISEGRIESLFILEDVHSPIIYNTLYLGVVFVPNTLSFYPWTEKVQNYNPLNLCIPQIPKNILSSSDSGYMVMIFDDYFTVHLIENDILLTVGSFRSRVHSGYIYEGFIFIFLNDKGVFYQILSKEITYPIKILRLSDDINLYHIKLSKRIKEKNGYFTRKLLSQKIVGVFLNQLVFVNCINEYTIKDLDIPIFRLIYAITSKRIEEINQILSNIEIKYIKLVNIVLKNYLPEKEQLFRKIYYNQDMIEHFQLYQNFDFFIENFQEEKVLNGKKKAEFLYKGFILEYLRNNNTEGLNKLYQLSTSQNNKLSLLVSKFIDEQNLLKTLLTHQRLFESYVFNDIYKVNSVQQYFKHNIRMGEKILLKAYENLNQKKINN